jgi:hypothetical protein
VSPPTFLAFVCHYPIRNHRRPLLWFTSAARAAWNSLLAADASADRTGTKRKRRRGTVIESRKLEHFDLLIEAFTVPLWFSIVKQQLD